MIGESVREAHILNLLDSVFTGFPSFDIKSKIYFPCIFLWQVAYQVPYIHTESCTLNFGVALLGPVPAVGFIIKFDKVLMLFTLAQIEMFYRFCCSFYSSF